MRRLQQARPMHVALAVFLIAITIRAVYLLDIRDNPFYDTPVIDAEFYHEQAASLASGSGLARAPFQMPPLYPLLLALVYKLFGVRIEIAHVLQIVLGALTAASTWELGRRVGGITIGLIAAGCIATSKALIYLEGDLLATPLVVFMDAAFLVFLLRWLQDGERRRDLVGAGVTFGAAALALPLVLTVAPVLGLWIWRRGRGRAAIAMALIATAVIAPVTVRNRITSGQWVAISANGGINFYLGNNPEHRITSALRPGPEWRALQNRPFLAGVVAPAARDRWFLREGLRFWIESPLQALGAIGEKTLLLVQNHEIMRDFDVSYFRDHYSWLLRLPSWNFALLFGAALVGLVLARTGTPGERALQCFAAAYAAALVLFFVTARYRAPLLPVLAVFAARGLLAAWQRRRDRTRILRALGVAVAGILVSCIDPFQVARVDAIEARYRVATTLEKRGDFAAAVRAYDAVRADAPGHLLAAARAAVCTQHLGQVQEAVERYEAILAQHPDYAEAAFNLANLAWRHGDRAAAANFFEYALEADPVQSEGLGTYGLFLLEGGDVAAAVDAFARALEIDPYWEALRPDYARALLANGELPAARREIDRAARALPPAAAVELIRGDVLRAQGDATAARQAWERGLRLEPGNAALRQRLQAS